MKFDKFPDMSTKGVTPPQSEQELMERCKAIAGKTLGCVAYELGLIVPDDLTRHKGWVGQLLELALGANAGNRTEPDFVQLAIELKTLPLNKHGVPKESTYVCTVAMQHTGELNWHQSWLKRKLQHVLWLPVEADNAIPLAERYIGQAWLWQPNDQQKTVLQSDWEELMDRVVLGEQGEITAKEGQYLQIRPKAAHSRIVTYGTSESGEINVINPKGFYLRTAFTKQLLQQG